MQMLLHSHPLLTVAGASVVFIACLGYFHQLPSDCESFVSLVVASVLLGFHGSESDGLNYHSEPRLCDLNQRVLITYSFSAAFG